MAQTKAGAKKAMATIRAKHGEDFHHKIGAIGGKKGSADGTIKGFALMTLEQRRAAGARGGKNGKRSKLNVN